jgi:hypothetical protein
MARGCSPCQRQKDSAGRIGTLNRQNATRKLNGLGAVELEPIQFSFAGAINKKQI